MKLSLRRGLLIVAAGVIGTLVATKWYENLLLALTVMNESQQALIGDAGRSLTYSLARSDRLEFDLPAEHDEVRLVVNATCPKDVDRSKAVAFDIVYDVTERGGTPSGARSYTFRSRPTGRVIDERGARIDRLFVRDPSRVPCDGRVILIDTSGVRPGARTLSLSLGERDEDVSDVLVRVYYSRGMTALQSRYRWERMSRAKKEQLTRWNVYPPDLISEEEKLLHSRHEWVAVAPRGVVGKDYRMEIVYRRRDGTPAEVETHAIGMRVRPGRVGVAPLPVAETTITVTVERSPGEDPHAPVPVTFVWHGGASEDARESTDILTGARMERSWRFAGGELEVRAEQPVLVRVFAGEELEEITPEKRWLRAWVSEEGEEVVFDVGHSADRPTPLRVDLRACAEDEEGASRLRVDVEWALLDEDGVVVREGRVLEPSAPSRYDAVAGDRERRVSEPISRYFKVEPVASRLRVRSLEGTALIAAFDRLTDVAHDVRVPEDRSAFERRRTGSRSWFYLRPRAWKDLVRQGRVSVLALQSEPAEADERRLAGKYRFTSFEPAGRVESRDLLIPREVDVVFDRGLAGVVYAEIPAGRDVTLYFAASAGASHVEPRVVWARVDGRGAWPRVMVDQRLLVDDDRERIVPLRVEADATHTVRVDAEEGTRVFLSHVVPPGYEGFLARRAFLIGDDPVTFRYERTSSEDEVLLAHFWSSGSPERSTVCARISPVAASGDGPWAALTFDTRRFDVLPGELGAAVAIGGEWGGLRGGRAMALPLRSDLPPGRYEIEWTFEPGTTGYITLTQLTLGEFDDYRFYSE